MISCHKKFFLLVCAQSLLTLCEGYAMNYAKIIGMVVLLGAINMCAMGKEAMSSDSTLIARIDSDGTSVIILNAGTQKVIKNFAFNGSVASIEGFSGNKKLLVTVMYMGGICPDHIMTKTVMKTLSLHDDSCFMQ